jgi:hypothetical protein
LGAIALALAEAMDAAPGYAERIEDAEAPFWRYVREALRAKGS